MTPLTVERHPVVGNAAHDLVPLPGESIISSLWRFAWRNGLRAKELLRFCSPYLTYDKENTKWTGVPGFDANIFARSSGWPKQLDERKCMEVTRKHHLGMWWASNFRYCPLCLENAYHSFWHQNLFITHCPLDGAMLSTGCHCCGRLLPTYGFHHKLLDRPYTCEHCGGPVSGVVPQIKARLEMQGRSAEIKRAFLLMALWWEVARPVREEFEFLFGERNVYTYSPWLRSYTSIRQWVLDRTPTCSSLALPSRTIPELVVLKWRVQLAPPDPRDVFKPNRTPADVQLDLARQVYMSTLRTLTRAIQTIAPFDDAEHRRTLALAPSDLMRHPSGCNMYLIALVVLRRQYETYYSLMHEDVSEAQFRMELANFGSELTFGKRIRIYWRLRFLAEFGAIYWCLIALRSGNAEAARGNLSQATLEVAKVDSTVECGDLAAGSAAFPALEGFDLCLLARRPIKVVADWSATR
jgi:hypothetical protein